MMFLRTRLWWTLSAFVCFSTILGLRTNSQDTYLSEFNQITNAIDKTTNEACKHYIQIYANVSSSFMQCAVTHAKPLNFCERCVSKYILVLQTYNRINKEVKCSSHLLRSDFLQVISKTNNFLNDLWNTGHCDNCFNKTYMLNEKTRHFIELYNQTMNCFYNFSMAGVFPPVSDNNMSLSELCIECKPIYKQLYAVYKKIRAGTVETEMCVDVLEKMNITQKIMSDDYHCNIHDKNREFVWAVSLFFCLLPIIFYLLARWYGGKEFKQKTCS